MSNIAITTSVGLKESTTRSVSSMSGSVVESCPMPIQHHQHHHHFYSHPQEPSNLGPQPSSQQQLHQHHQQQQQQLAHHHLHHHHFQAQATSSNSFSESSSLSSPDSTRRCCSSSCRCSNRLLTGIVITILPIAITSTLICVFMMQKTNLHQYAIYSFVIFCVAFVFPFALFFFTVVLNKIYKFYKREIRSTPRSHLNSLVPDMCDPEMSSTGYSMQSSVGNATNMPVPGRALLLNNSSNSCHQAATTPTPGGTGQSASLICYSSRAYHPYYYHIEDGTIVAYAPDSSVAMEDSPPSYEMALLCPSVTHHHHPYPPGTAIINAPIQVILPKEQCKEKPYSRERLTATEPLSSEELPAVPSAAATASAPSLSACSEQQLNTAENEYQQQQDSNEDSNSSGHHLCSPESETGKSVDSGQSVVIATG